MCGMPCGKAEGPPSLVVADARQAGTRLGDESRYDRRMQTRYLILASLVTALAILAAGAVWFAGL